MLGQGFVSAAAIAASILFVLSLGGLSNQEKAKRAVWYGIVGMAVAVLFTAFGPGIGNYWLMIPMIVIGSVIGWKVAKQVAMTEMPQLVAALHSFVGLAAVFVAWNADLERRRVLAAQALDTAHQEFSAFAALVATKAPDELTFLQLEVVFAIFIGAVTFTGSVVAFGKL
ncbi:MAG: NAD(P)(+) transhydrogenase (Re/Si-specific) subunit beta, partial [Billgrantia desiderata]